ncbi:MAG TPA: peroxiredoxin [Trueperaceae bacterium]
MPTEVSSGEAAPTFEKESTHGVQRLEDYRGQWVVLYFYPKDETPGCTAEACDFRDALPGMDAVVLGVSPDPLESHRQFQENHSLPFPLITDEDHSLAEAYGAWGEKQIYGQTVVGVIRSTFIIDPQGRIAEAMRNVKATGHVERVRKRLAVLQK